MKGKKRGWVSSTPAYLNQGEACLALMTDFFFEKDNASDWWQPVRYSASGMKIAGRYLNVTDCTEWIVGWVATISLKLCILTYKYQGSPIFEFLSASAWESNRRITEVSSIWVNCRCCICGKDASGFIGNITEVLRNTSVLGLFSP